MRRLGVVVAVLVLVSGLTTGASAQSEDLRPFTGTWTGTMTASAGSGASEAGPSSAPARFVLLPDGQWTLTCSGTAVGTARRVGQRLILEGKMTEGDQMSLGRTVSLILRLQGADFLYGYGDSFLEGARTGGGISLRKVGS